MRYPNGFGSVYKLSGNRRRPWAARKTIGYKDNGQQKFAFIGFYATRKEAMEALSVYNAKPYDKKATFGECADAWLEEALPGMKEATRKAYFTSAKRCAPLRPKRIADIRLVDMQTIVDEVTHSVGMMTKTYLSKVFDYAVRHEVLPAERHQIVKYIRLSDDMGHQIKRTVFTPEEMAKITNPLYLILLYTGLRVSEMLDLREEDIHLEERWLYVRRSKTPSGIRSVPICEKIVPCFSALPANMLYAKFKKHFRADTGHLPHDCRHTFISMCADAGIDSRITKAIVGHTGTDITETVYTHIDMSVLLEAVNRL